MYFTVLLYYEQKKETIFEPTKEDVTTMKMVLITRPLSLYLYHYNYFHIPFERHDRLNLSICECLGVYYEEPCNSRELMIIFRSFIFELRSIKFSSLWRSGFLIYSELHYGKWIRDSLILPRITRISKNFMDVNNVLGNTENLSHLEWRECLTLFQICMEFLQSATDGNSNVVIVIVTPFTVEDSNLRFTDASYYIKSISFAFIYPVHYSNSFRLHKIGIRVAGPGTYLKSGHLSRGTSSAYENLACDLVHFRHPWDRTVTA